MYFLVKKKKSYHANKTDDPLFSRNKYRMPLVRGELLKFLTMLSRLGTKIGAI